MRFPLAVSFDIKFSLLNASPLTSTFFKTSINLGIIPAVSALILGIVTDQKRVMQLDSCTMGETYSKVPVGVCATDMYASASPLSISELVKGILAL